MFDGDVAELDADAALAVVAEARVTADRAESLVLAVAAHFADLHPAPGVDRDDGEWLPGMERARVYGAMGVLRWRSSRRPSWVGCSGSVHMLRRI